MMKHLHALALVAVALAIAAGARAAGNDAAPVFRSTPDPSTVQRFYEPPASLEGSIVGVRDPWETFNRRMYRFNARFDHAVFLPVVDGYRWITPDPVETGVSHFFENLLEVRNLANNALQLHGEDALVSGARFVVNTTLGLGGVFDPATKMGLNVRKEDFGQTLGHWGVGAGPYLVLPLLGPSGLRDAGGLAVDIGANSWVDPLQIEGVRDDAAGTAAYNGTKAVDARSTTAFRYYRTGSPFEYELVRFAYTRMRQVEIER
jgi:phospholipid-binding lipoprotein MlaA